MKVKGSVVASIPEFVKDRFGAEGFKTWTKSLPPQSQEIISSVILATNWYPIESHFIIPTVKLCELFTKGSLKGAWDAGRYSCEKALTGAFRTLLKPGDPNYIADKAPLFVKQIYEPSAVAIIKNEKNLFIMHITQLPMLHEAIETRLCGFIEYGLQLSGAKNVKVKITKSLCRKDPYTEFYCTWTI